MFRLLLCKVTDALMEELERSITRCGLPQVAQFIFLGLADNGQLAQALLGILHHQVSDSDDALGKSASHALAIDGVIVLDDHATRFNFDIDFEFGDIQFEHFMINGLAIYGIL